MTITDWHRQVFHSRAASLSEDLLPENVHFVGEYGADIAASQQQAHSLFSARSAHADLISNQYIINPAQGVVLLSVNFLLNKGSVFKDGYVALSTPKFREAYSGWF